MQSELKPCPFCGSDNICPSSWDIQCQDCKAMMPGEPEEASLHWNRRALTDALSDKQAGEVKEMEEAVRLAEIGEYLYNRAYSYGNGYDEPREFGIEWQWQQSKPNEFGQGALLAEATKWHSDMAEDGIVTGASKLRSALVDVPAVEPVAWMDDGTCRAGSDRTAHRVVTDAQKRDMPEAIASSFTTPLYSSPPLSREGEDTAEVERRFSLEWVSGARPPVHPDPMRGRQSFRSFDQAIAFMNRQANDAKFVSLTEYEEREFDRSEEARASIAATRSGSASTVGNIKLGSNSVDGSEDRNAVVNSAPAHSGTGGGE